MAMAVVLYMDDEGNMSVGEADPELIDTADFQEVENFEEAVVYAEGLVIGPEDAAAEEAAFNESVGAPVKDPMMDEME